MVTGAKLIERRQRLLGEVFSVVGVGLRIRVSSYTATSVRFVAVDRGIKLSNPEMSWATFADSIRKGALVEAW